MTRGLFGAEAGRDARQKIQMELLRSGPRDVRILPVHFQTLWSPSGRNSKLETMSNSNVMTLEHKEHTAGV